MVHCCYGAAGWVSSPLGGHPRISNSKIHLGSPLNSEFRSLTVSPAVPKFWKTHCNHKSQLIMYCTYPKFGSLYGKAMCLSYPKLGYYLGKKCTFHIRIFGHYMDTQCGCRIQILGHCLGKQCDFSTRRYVFLTGIESSVDSIPN